MNKLNEKITVGSYELNNRIAMAPLTRNRAAERLVPTWLNSVYYRQRAGAGLIISEATVISKEGVGYQSTPGIFTDEQIEGWKRVTEAVHQEEGARIFCQLWHCGRSSHPDFHGGRLPVSASDISPGGSATTYNGVRKRVSPRALSIEEIQRIIHEYAQAAKNSIEAGFDGVEIHAANGYLIDQFICDGSNKRTDDYGGPIENRIRFALEVAEAVADSIGRDKTGIRLSPSGIFNGMSDSSPVETFTALVKELNKLQLAYLHVMEPYSPPGKNLEPPERYLQWGEVAKHFRKFWDGILIANSGFDTEEGEALIGAGHADMLAFGKLYISNPDLDKRIENGISLNKWNSSTFYGGDDRGYIDYPTIAEVEAGGA